MSEQNTNRPVFDPGAPHMAMPKLRRVRGFPVPAQTPDGKQAVLMGLADAQQISQKMIAAPPAFQAVLPLLDGTRSLDQVVSEVGRGLTRQMLESFVAQLDEAALIEGPGFEALLAESRAKFDETDVLPPGSTAQFADMLVATQIGEGVTEEQKRDLGPTRLGEQIDAWMEQAMERLPGRPIESLPRAVVAPHVDYHRGWINYAAIWGRLRGLDRPDRIVVLGTNHFGSSTGVCGCDKGFQSPLGTCPADADLIERISAHLGEAQAEKLFEHRYDHENEHSIELQMPWIHRVFAPDESGASVPVFAALVHDPAVNNGESYDGQGLDLDPFVDALRAALADLGGRTLIVSSADLSHVGPAFGDQQRTSGDDDQAKALRDRVARHDQEMLALIKERKPDELVGAMAWQQNPTRWCSIGNIVAALRVAEPERVDVLAYVAAVDPQGSSLVSSAAVVME